jgi:uncharacterized protein (DUF58 family)
MNSDTQQRRFLDFGVISRLSALPLSARHAMVGNVSGRHVSPHRGSSVEFAAYREYSPGDDLRRLDWRAWGRSDRYYVKEFEADTNLRCCLFLDTSGSMGYASGELSKFEYALRLAGTLGYLAVSQGDAVGLTCISEGVTSMIPPRRNPAHLRAVFDLMEGARPQGQTRLVDALHEMAETIKQRALVILVSDLFLSPDLLPLCFEHFRFRKHDLAVFHVLDPQEINFQFSRPTRFVDLERGESILAEPNVIEANYRTAVQAYLAQMTQVMRNAGVDYHRTLTDVPVEKCLAEFLLRRIQTGGRR